MSIYNLCLERGLSELLTTAQGGGGAGGLVAKSDSCNPSDCSLPGFPVHGISQARILEWVAISFSRESSWPRHLTHVSCIAGRFFIAKSPGRLPQSAEGLRSSEVYNCFLSIRVLELRLAWSQPSGSVYLTSRESRQWKLNSLILYKDKEPLFKVRAGLSRRQYHFQRVSHFKGFHDLDNFLLRNNVRATALLHQSVACREGQLGTDRSDLSFFSLICVPLIITTSCPSALLGHLTHPKAMKRAWWEGSKGIGRCGEEKVVVAMRQEGRGRGTTLKKPI